MDSILKPLSEPANVVDYLQREICSGNLAKSIDTGSRGSLVAVCVAGLLAFGALIVPEMYYVDE